MQQQDTSTIYDYATVYQKRGWSVIPVHGISLETDRCTCNKIDCPNPGKHPIERDWPQTRLTLPDVYTVFAERYPWANVGIIMGEAVGVFALDIDPKNGGDETLHRLIEENGPLSDTYTQQTGSGGEHYIFTHPDFHIKGDTTGKIFGPGIDIRAHNNMIVMAGSRTDKGLYVAKNDVRPTCAPEWVLERLRSPVITGEGETTTVEGLPEYSRLDPYEQERVQKYAIAAIEAECRGYAQSPPGHGNAALYKAACNIIEIAQSPWNTISLQTAKDLLNSSRLRRLGIHQYGGGQTESEFNTTWNSARSTVAGQGRPYPPNPYKDLEFDHPFDGTPVIITNGDADLEFVFEEDELTPDFEQIEEELRDIEDVEKRKNKLMGIIPHLLGLNAIDIYNWRELCKQHGITKGTFNELLKESQEKKDKEREELAKAKLAHKAQILQEQGLILPAPHKPLDVARALIKRWEKIGQVTPAWWRGDFYKYADTHWKKWEDSSVHQTLYAETGNANYVKENGQILPWGPKVSLIKDLEHALGRGTIQRNPAEEEDRCVACTNGVLDLETLTLTEHTPHRFNLSCLPFAYDPIARCPQWEAFLNEVLPGDVEAQQFLREWFGYVISGRTDLQKMANLHGAKRSGKGTIARILEALLGPESVTSPTLTSLAGLFGKQPLIGKKLAVFSDVNWSVRDIGEAVEELKAISGEDSRDVHRKNREAWHGKLGVRFMLMSNDLPTFKDASGALAGRMIHVGFTVSFYEREDPTLTDRLLGELPGILNWALQGLTTLTTRGRFAPPESSRNSEEEILRLTAPVVGFLQDRAVVGSGGNGPFPGELLLDNVHGAYLDWCREEDKRQHTYTRDVFSKELRSAGNGKINIHRRRGHGKREQWVSGLSEAYQGSLTPRPGWSPER